MNFYVLIYQNELKAMRNEVKNGYFYFSYPYYRTFLRFVPKICLIFYNMLFSNVIYHFSHQT